MSKKEESMHSCSNSFSSKNSETLLGDNEPIEVDNTETGRQAPTSSKRCRTRRKSIRIRLANLKSCHKSPAPSKKVTDNDKEEDLGDPSPTKLFILDHDPMEMIEQDLEQLREDYDIPSSTNIVENRASLINVGPITNLKKGMNSLIFTN